MIETKHVDFKEEWTTSRSVQEAFDELKKGFLDSKSSSIWPVEYSELKAQSSTFKKGIEIKATYKTGPITSNSIYTMSEVTAPDVIAYETTKKHLLKGGAKITLQKLPSGKTLVTWEGHYKRNNLKGALGILWFKNYFRDAFFREIKRKL